MIAFEKFQLQNGLTVLVHEDASTEMAVVNLLYKVGSRNESPEKTGFAHFFEHLMFGGSKHVTNFDRPLDMAGGENNAFTSTDITNYYEQLPAVNIETALWMESDRMGWLNINEHTVETQRKVVIEEFKERYINPPYGDAWHHIRDMAYEQHPYKWPTIGAKIKHIEDATITEVAQFYKKHYAPSNAILSIAGGITVDKAKALAEKWFADIASTEQKAAAIPVEPVQTKGKSKTVTGDVPLDAIYKVYHMCDRHHPDYYASDLLSDIMCNGKSTRIYQRLVKEQQLFNNIDAYITGSCDNGLFVIEGKLSTGITMEAAEAALEAQLTELKEALVEPLELSRAINKIISANEFQDVSLMGRAFALAYYESLGNAKMINGQSEIYEQITAADIQQVANQIFTEQNCSTLYYLKNEN